MKDLMSHILQGTFKVVCKMTEKWCIGVGLALMGKAVDVG
jgi:hypothetical protein